MVAFRSCVRGKGFLSHTHTPLRSFPEGIPSGCLLPGLCWAAVCQLGSVQVVGPRLKLPQEER